MRVGATGYTNLSDDSVPLIADAVRAHLSALDVWSLVGVSCLARSADSTFAKVIGLGGRFEVLLPSSDYREAKVKPDHAAQSDPLLGRRPT